MFVLTMMYIPLKNMLHKQWCSTFNGGSYRTSNKYV